MKNVKMKLLSLSISTAILIPSTSVFAASNVKTASRNTQTTITTPVIHHTGIIKPQYVSSHQPYVGFNGTCWCTADAVYLRDLDGTIIGTLTYGEAIHVSYVSGGKAYHNTVGSPFTIDVRYLSTVEV